MNNSPTGLAIGNDAYAAQAAAGVAFLEALAGTLPNGAQSAAFAQLVAQLLGQAIITHCPGWDHINYAPNADPGFDRPRPAVVSQDNDAGETIAIWWKTGDAPTAWRSLLSDSDLGKVKAIAPGSADYLDNRLKVLAPLKSEIVGAMQELSVQLSIEPQDPVVEGAKLTLCKKEDPKLRRSARALLPHGSDIWGFGSGVHQVAGISTWQSDTNGPIWLFDTSGNPTILANDGDIVLGYLPGSGSAHAGLYEIVDCGIHSPDGSPWPGSGPNITSKATIRRTADANTPAGLCNGMVVQITGVGVEHGGDYFTITTSDPIVVDTTVIQMSIASSYTPASPTTYPLLTNAQIASGNADSGIQSLQVTIVNGYADLQACTTLSGTPGLDKLLAGLNKFQALAKLDAYDPVANPGDTYLAFRVIVTNAAGTSIESEWISQCPQAITWTTPSLLNWDYTQGADITMAADMRLVVIPRLITTCLLPVTLTLSIGPAAGTWWQSTMQFGSTIGTNEHQKLIDLKADVAKGDEPRHPASAIGAGRLHTPFTAAATVSNTAITMPEDSNSAELEGGNSLAINGIIPDGWMSGDHLYITVTGSTPTSPTVFNGNTDPPPLGAKALILGGHVVNGTIVHEPKLMIFTDPARLHFQLRGNFFELLSVQL